MFRLFSVSVIHKNISKILQGFKNDVELLKYNHISKCLKQARNSSDFIPGEPGYKFLHTYNYKT